MASPCDKRSLRLPLNELEWGGRNVVLLLRGNRSFHLQDVSPTKKWKVFVLLSRTKCARCQTCFIIIETIPANAEVKFTSPVSGQTSWVGLV